jgi:hypothetical protein
VRAATPIPHIAGREHCRASQPGLKVVDARSKCAPPFLFRAILPHSASGAAISPLVVRVLRTLAGVIKISIALHRDGVGCSWGGACSGCDVEVGGASSENALGMVAVIITELSVVRICSLTIYSDTIRSCWVGGLVLVYVCPLGAHASARGPLGLEGAAWLPGPAVGWSPVDRFGRSTCYYF